MKRKLFILVILIIVFSAFSTKSFARATDYSEKPTIGVESEYINTGECYIDFDYTIIKSFSDSSLILNTSAGLGKLSDNTLEGYASIMCSNDVNTLSYSMVFEEWNGYDWSNIKTSSKSTRKSQYLDGYHYCDAELQNYYRIKVSFYADNETRTMYSKFFQLK